jgi:hypothetical protein
VKPKGLTKPNLRGAAKQVLSCHPRCHHAYRRSICSQNFGGSVASQDEQRFLWCHLRFTSILSTLILSFYIIILSFQEIKLCGEGQEFGVFTYLTKWTHIYFRSNELKVQMGDGSKTLKGKIKQERKGLILVEKYTPSNVHAVIVCEQENYFSSSWELSKNILGRGKSRATNHHPRTKQRLAHWQPT